MEYPDILAPGEEFIDYSLKIGDFGGKWGDREEGFPEGQCR